MRGFFLVRPLTFPNGAGTRLLLKCLEINLFILSIPTGEAMEICTWSPALRFDAGQMPLCGQLAQQKVEVNEAAVRVELGQDPAHPLVVQGVPPDSARPATSCGPPRRRRGTSAVRPRPRSSTYSADQRPMPRSRVRALMASSSSRESRSSRAGVSPATRLWDNSMMVRALL